MLGGVDPLLYDTITTGVWEIRSHNYFCLFSSSLLFEVGRGEIYMRVL